MIPKRARLVCFCFLTALVLPVLSLNAQNSAILTVYESIDNAFMTKSPNEVRNLLASERSSSEYPEYEDYVIRKSRGLLISNQLELIQEMTLAVIDNNLDCQDAINLYMLVEGAIQKRDESRREEIAQKETQKAIVEQASEQQRTQAKKAYTEVQNTASGEAVYVGAKQTAYYSNYAWDAELFIGDFGLAVTDGLSVKYGLAAQGTFLYRAHDWSLGASVYADNLIFGLDGVQTRNYAIDLVPQFSFLSINENLFYRTGISFQTNDSVPFTTPVVGIGMRHHPGDILAASWFVDYYAGHLFNPDIAFGAGLGGTLSFGVAKFGDSVFSVSLGLRENLIVTSAGNIQSRTRICLGLGVGSNE